MSRIDQYGQDYSPAPDVEFVVNDPGDITMGPNGTTKRVALAALIGTTVWPSGDTTGTADAAALNAALTAIGMSSARLVMKPGQWYLKPGAVSAMQLVNAQTLVIDGQGGAVVNAVAGASGDIFRMYNPATQTGGYTSNGFSVGSGITGLTIDGTNADAGSTGLHIGDLMRPELDIHIRNFTGTGSVGLHFDNSVSWTEQANVEAFVENCASLVVFEVTNGWQSFGYGAYDFTLEAWPGQDGVVLKNGAYVYNGPRFSVRGNFGASSTPSANAVLRLTGQCPVGSPNAGSSSALYAEQLDVQVESNGPGSYGAQTLFVDSGCYVSNCTGILNFLAAGASFTPSNLSVATAGYQFQAFNGIIQGDVNLNPATTGSGWTAGGPILFTQAQSPVYSGIAYPDAQGGDFFSVTLSGNTTIALNYSGGEQGGPQRKTIVIQQPATGGTYNYTVTWPHPGSPTLTSPTVKWAGGAAPTMSTGAGATDVYDLSTLDGVTWYGRVLANVS